MKKFVKGQDVYIVPSDSRDKPFHAKIVSIGSKYITVDSLHLHYTENKFYVSDLSHIHLWPYTFQKSVITKK